MKLLPGSIVLNQDSGNPMCREVISHIGRDVRIKWVNGLINNEDVSDLTLTADVEFDHAGSAASARADIQDAISMIDNLRADLVQATAKIDLTRTKLGRANTRLYATAQPRGQ